MKGKEDKTHTLNHGTPKNRSESHAHTEKTWESGSCYIPQVAIQHKIMKEIVNETIKATVMDLAVMDLSYGQCTQFDNKKRRWTK